MAALPFTCNALHKAEMEYHGKFGHTLGGIYNIYLASRIDICDTSCRLDTQTLAPTLPCFLGIKRCIIYLSSHPHKPIFYPSNSYYGSNVIRSTCIDNKVEYYTTQNCL